MASLDFAFVSESARLEPGNTLSALGIGFTHIQLSRFPIAVPVAVAGMAWLEEEDGGKADLVVTLVGAQDSYELSVEQTLFAPEGEPYMEGRQAACFVAPLTLPLTTEGIYRVNLKLNGTLARSIQLEVMRPLEAPDVES